VGRLNKSFGVKGLKEQDVFSEFIESNRIRLFWYERLSNDAYETLCIFFISADTC
jgi:hypothetical protein